MRDDMVTKEVLICSAKLRDPARMFDVDSVKVEPFVVDDQIGAVYK